MELWHSTEVYESEEACLSKNKNKELSGEYKENELVFYRVRSKKWPSLVLGLVTTFLLRFLQFNLISCLL